MISVSACIHGIKKPIKLIILVSGIDELPSEAKGGRLAGKKLPRDGFECRWR